MLLKTAYIHMKRTPALDHFALQKIGDRLKKLAKGPIYADLTFIVEKGKHRASLVVKDKVGKPIQLEHQSDNMYEAVARLGQRLERLLRKRKTKFLALRQKSYLKGSHEQLLCHEQPAVEASTAPTRAPA